MSRMWMPPAVSHELREETAKREAWATHGLLEERDAWVDDFNRDLENVHPGMRLLWCPDPAPVEAVAMGARPGRWGILLPSRNGGAESVMPILGPDEEFVDPSLNASKIFEQLRGMDWWNPQVKRDRERAKEEARKASEKRKEQEREEMNQDIYERYMAVNRAFVSMHGPWTQNQAGRRAVKKGKN